jgi:hypothetical protein
VEALRTAPLIHPAIIAFVLLVHEAPSKLAYGCPTRQDWRYCNLLWNNKGARQRWYPPFGCTQKLPSESWLPFLSLRAGSKQDDASHCPALAGIPAALKQVRSVASQDPCSLPWILPWWVTSHWFPVQSIHVPHVWNLHLHPVGML